MLHLSFCNCTKYTFFCVYLATSAKKRQEEMEMGVGGRGGGGGLTGLMPHHCRECLDKENFAFRPEKDEPLLAKALSCETFAFE